MKDQHSDSLATAQSGKFPEEFSTSEQVQTSPLMQFFEEELKAIYSTERALAKFIQGMIKYATSEELIETLQDHLAETAEQELRIERVFKILGKKAYEKKCEGIEGLIREAQIKMEECEEGSMCDAAMISTAQKIEHYEIASYRTLIQLAETLALDKAVKLFQTTLEEEIKTVEILTEIAKTTSSIYAAHEVS